MTRTIPEKVIHDVSGLGARQLVDDPMKADLHWRFELTNPDGSPVSGEERQEFMRKAAKFSRLVLW